MRSSERKVGLTFSSLCLLVAWLAVAIALLEPAKADGATATSAALTIQVGNVNPHGGILRLGLYDAAHYPDDNSMPAATADVAVKAGVSLASITLRDLKPGTYAIEMFQDLNGDGEMDTSWFGFPLEPFGFSRDARPHLHKPRFAQVQFTVAAGENVQDLRLQNSISLIAAE